MPAYAILVPGMLAIGVALTGDLEGVFVAMVLAGILSYIFMMAAHIRLRRTHPDLLRPYFTPGGCLTSAFALASACILLAACMFTNPRGAIAAILLLSLPLILSLALRHAGCRKASQPRR